MKLDNKKLYSLLKGKGINYLFHANTMSTSLTFLKGGGLMSRGYVEELGLYQTGQRTDTLDKQYNVWNDVFLDMTDLHEVGFGTYKRENVYGPVLFKFNIDFITKEDFDIWIMTDNPTNWSRKKEDERYFKDIEHLENEWTKHISYHKMVTLRNIKKPILFNYLEEIIIDRPTKYQDKLSEEFLEKLNTQYSLGDKIRYRNTCINCYCNINYKGMNIDKIKYLFSPNYKK